MIIAGAGGHALEVLSILEENKFGGTICFFDDRKSWEGDSLFNHRIIESVKEATDFFLKDPAFVIGVGKPVARKLLYDKLINAGGKVQAVISPFAHIGNNGMVLGEGLNIMTGAVITATSMIGKGSLVHIHASVHHDTIVGEFCELSPGCRILGNVRIGDFVSVGAGAILLPGVQVGDHAVIGAGAVVTRNVNPGHTVVGVPAKQKNQ